MSKININKLGYGFINIYNKTIFIPKQKINNASDGDVVEYNIIDENNNIGEITKILKSSPIYCKVNHIWNDFYVLKTIDFIKKQIYVKQNEFNLNINDIIKYNNGMVLENYGNNKETIYNYLLNKYNLKNIYNSSLKEINTNEILNSTDRINLTDLDTFTIDPTSSKDFDDAISIVLNKDSFTLYIHIADVSHYIKPNTQLDNIAKDAMNTIYFNGKIIHMLPKFLSNDLCSLLPNKERRTVTVMINYDLNGKELDYKIFRSLIKNKKRYTYEKVRNQINTSSMDKNIKKLYDFIKKLYPDIDKNYCLPIPHINLDDNLKPSNITLEEYDLSHRMIEKCMVIANNIVARELTKRKVWFPYRVHQNDNNEKKNKYNKYLNYSTNKIYRQIIKVKSYTTAFYSPEKKSHNGLNLDMYCHFTSPIRRYIDIVIHRILLNDYDYSLEELNQICNHANKKESYSFKAENELIDIHKNQYLDKEENKDKIYNLLIIDVYKNGIKVQILDIMMEQIIHISKLSKNRLSFNNKQLFNKQNNELFKIGDIIKLPTN
jgi:ribonuclease R